MTSSETKRYPWLIWLVCFIYVVLVTVWSGFHELWRDEVLPLSCVVESDSLSALFVHYKNSGHPMLWPIILYYAYQIFPSYSILAIVNLVVIALAAYVFLKKAPFPWLQKILFLLGYFIFYYFPVFNRPYGLCWFLFLLFCVLFEQRWKKILPLSIVLFFLANTVIAGLIIALAVWFMLGVEFFTWGRRDALRQNSVKNIIGGLVIVLIGILASIWQLRTDSSSDIFSWNSLNLQQIGSALQQAVFSPGIIFRHVLGGSNKILVTFTIFGCYLLLIRQWAALGIIFLSTIGLSMFFQIFYPYYDLYHESAVYMLMIFAFWVTANQPSFGRVGSYARNLFFIAVLVSQIFMAYPAIKFDVLSDYSSSKRFAEWIKAQPSGKDHVLITEPDYLIGGLPYYVPNDIYVPREGVFSRVTQDTARNQQVFSLEEFLRTAEDLEAQGRDVLLVMGHRLNKNGPFEIKFSYNKIFRYSPESLALWEQRTALVASFRGSTEEEFDVFVLK